MNAKELIDKLLLLKDETEIKIAQYDVTGEIEPMEVDGLMYDMFTNTLLIK